MEIQTFTGVNWDHPSKQNLIDLYITRMDLISYATGFYIDNGYEPTSYILDDTRTSILSMTGISVEKYDSLIDEAIHILSEDGIPEIFVSDTFWESWKIPHEPSNDDRDEAFDLVYEIYQNHIFESREIRQRFNEIVKVGA
jgi:hypothetical protein